MIVKPEDMEIQKVEGMRGGPGTVEIRHLIPSDKVPHGRMMAHVTLPVGAGIGQHEHIDETEYYIIAEGEGIVEDNGTPVTVKAGDVVVTPNKNSHNITNTGSVPLKMYAVILFD